MSIPHWLGTPSVPSAIGLTSMCARLRPNAERGRTGRPHKTLDAVEQSITQPNRGLAVLGQDPRCAIRVAKPRQRLRTVFAA